MYARTRFVSDGGGGGTPPPVVEDERGGGGGEGMWRRQRPRIDNVSPWLGTFFRIASVCGGEVGGREREGCVGVWVGVVRKMVGQGQREKGRRQNNTHTAHSCTHARTHTHARAHTHTHTPRGHTRAAARKQSNTHTHTHMNDEEGQQRERERERKQIQQQKELPSRRCCGAPSIGVYGEQRTPGLVCVSVCVFAGARTIPHSKTLRSLVVARSLWSRLTYRKS